MYFVTQIAEKESGGKIYLYVGVPQKLIYSAANAELQKHIFFVLAILTVSIGIAYADWKLFISKQIKKISLNHSS